MTVSRAWGPKMVGNASLSLLHGIRTLFDAGTAIGLSDRQLLEQFLEPGGAMAEAAFEVLVVRHGPMVLRVCRNKLPDSNDAEDAFQATFLVLARRGRSLRRFESVGSWLFGVDSRVAARTRVNSAKRRRAEQRAGLRLVRTDSADRDRDPVCQESRQIIHEEVRHLPIKYRSVVVLCYWEGLTQEQAAIQLGCPLGTVRSRLARARDLLHRRLIRRGLAPSAGIAALAVEVSTASATNAASPFAAVPTAVRQSTIQAATRLATGEATKKVASAFVATLVKQTLSEMVMIRFSKRLIPMSFGALTVLGVTLWAQQARRDRPRPQLRSQIATVDLNKSAVGAQYAPSHVVEPPDMLLVEVLEALPGRPISGERLVRPDGTISLGFYGDVRVAGLTLPEVKEKIILHLRKFLSDESLGMVKMKANLEPEVDPATNEPILGDPKKSDTVFVDVTAFNSKRYYVEGEVYEPGLIPVTGGDSVLDAIHYAGGIRPSADQSKIRLIRNYPKGSAIQVMPVNYEQITLGTDQSTNYLLLPNDRLVVPRDPNYKAGADLPDSFRSGHQARGENTRFLGGRTNEGSEEGLDSLRKVERRLIEVERKLDKIISALAEERVRTQAR
jgi:RNA polymerase sigma factor (sigma-70 family)